MTGLSEFGHGPMLYITLRQYEYLVAVARAGGLTAAARHLNVSQPSLSVAITRIEERLGRALFVRGKGVPFRTTAYGREVVVRAQTLLDQAGRLEDPAGLDPPVRIAAGIGFFDDLAPLWLAPTLATLRRDFPDADLAPFVGGFAALAKSLASGGIDLALTYDLGLDASHERAVIAQSSPHAFVPMDHPLATNERVSLKQLAKHPLVLFDDGLSIQHVLKLFAVRDLRPRVIHRATSLEIMRSLAAHGEGIGISYTRPPCTTSYDGRPLASVRIADRHAVESIVLAWPAESTSPLSLPRIVASLRRSRADADRPIQSRPIGAAGHRDGA